MRSVYLSAYFAHALLSLSKLEMGTSPNPDLEAAHEAAENLPNEHFPLEPEAHSTPVIERSSLTE